MGFDTYRLVACKLLGLYHIGVRCSSVLARTLRSPEQQTVNVLRVLSSTNKLKTFESGILTKVQDDLKGHESFNLHNLLDSPYINGDYSKLNIIHNVYNGEQIDIRGNDTGETVTTDVPPPDIPVQGVAGRQLAASAVPHPDVQPETPDTSIHSSASSEMQHQHGSSPEQTVKDLLKACFGADKTTRRKIESQIQNMFTDPLGMFQAFWANYVLANMDHAHVHRQCFIVF